MKLCLAKTEEMETPDFSLDGPPIVAGVADPQPRVVQGREIPVWQISDEGPDPAAVWKRLSVLLLGCIVFLIFMLVLKTFSC